MSQPILSMSGVDPDAEAQAEERRVVLVGVKMPFWSVVWFMVEWAIASIPALVIVTIVGWLAFLLVAGVFGALGALLVGPGR